MSNQLIFIKPWDQFQTELNQFVVIGNELKAQPATSNDDYNALDEKRRSWEKDIFAWLKSSFSNEINPMAIELNNVMANNFTVPSNTLVLKDQLFQFKGRIMQVNNYLLFKERILDVCDAIVRPDEQKINERAGFTLKQKQQFILEKLFDLYDDHFYPLEEILAGNGIKLNRNNEAVELAEILENLGYVEISQYAGQKASAKLTAEGAMFIEESRQPVREDYNDIDFSAAELTQKIDEIKSELTRLGLGHEILYDEMQELKELYKTLNKKNWGQLLKGKLLDIAISKAVDNATLEFVYKELTTHFLKLF